MKSVPAIELQLGDRVVQRSRDDVATGPIPPDEGKRGRKVLALKSVFGKLPVEVHLEGFGTWHFGRKELIWISND